MPPGRAAESPTWIRSDLPLAPPIRWLRGRGGGPLEVKETSISEEREEGEEVRVRSKRRGGLGSGDRGHEGGSTGPGRNMGEAGSSGFDGVEGKAGDSSLDGVGGKAGGSGLDGVGAEAEGVEVERSRGWRRRSRRRGLARRMGEPKRAATVPNRTNRERGAGEEGGEAEPEPGGQRRRRRAEPVRRRSRRAARVEGGRSEARAGAKRTKRKQDKETGAGPMKVMVDPRGGDGVRMRRATI